MLDDGSLADHEDSHRGAPKWVMSNYQESLPIVTSGGSKTGHRDDQESSPCSGGPKTGHRDEQQDLPRITRSGRISVIDTEGARRRVTR
jgi:hypothetical protein